MTKVEKAHDHQSDEEGIFAANEVAEAAKEESAEGTHDEADGEGRKIGDEGEGVVAGGVDLRGEDRGKAAEEVEVVPLDHGADGRGEDDARDAVCKLGHLCAG